jgi:hypothetical protein
VKTHLFYPLVASLFLSVASSNAAADSCAGNRSTATGDHFCLKNNSSDLTFTLSYSGSNKGTGENDECLNTVKNATVLPGQEVEFWFATKKKSECVWGAVAYDIKKKGASIGTLNLAVGNNEWFTNNNHVQQQGYVYKVGQVYGDQQVEVALDEGSVGPNFDCENDKKKARCGPEVTSGRLNY